MIEDLWYGHSRGARVGRALLSPFAGVFGAAAALRCALYDHGLLKSVDLGAAVVSVGALSVGGAGKTPFVLWLVSRLRDLGYRPCVLTRGYGGTARSPLLLTSADALGSAQVVADAGDEAVLIVARSGVPVAVAADRAAAARLARQHCDPDIFVLDDGFQHRRLLRDLDIVLVGGAEAELRLLPAGPLRERPSALARADVVVTTAPRTSGQAASTSAEAPRAVPSGASGPPAGAMLSMRLRATGLVSSRAGAVAWQQTAGGPSGASGACASPQIAGLADLSVLAGRRVAAVAGIAQPWRFMATLEEAGAVVVETMFFRDHHAYEARDWRRIEDLAARVDMVVTTEKDMVKLAVLAGGAGWLSALRVEAEVEGGDALLERIARFDRKRGATHHPPSFGGPAAW